MGLCVVHDSVWCVCSVLHVWSTHLTTHRTTPLITHLTTPTGCPVLLPNYALLSTDPSSDRQLPLPSPSRCCQACTLDPSCTSFVHNLTGTCTLQRGISAGRLIQGVTAALVDRAAVVRRRALQDTSSGKDGQAVQCPSVVMVPERGGLAAVLGRSGVTWQQVCCFNNLPDCSAPPVGAMLLIPCKDAAPKSCAVSDAVKTGEILGGGWRVYVCWRGGVY